MQPQPQRLLAARGDQLANAISGADTITFDRTMFASAQTITLTSALPAISDDLTIRPGATLATISGNDLYKLFYINFGKSLSISGLTLAHGRTPSGSGRHLQSPGFVTVTNSVFDSDVGSGTGGGAIYMSAAPVYRSAAPPLRGTPRFMAKEEPFIVMVAPVCRSAAAPLLVTWRLMAMVGQLPSSLALFCRSRTAASPAIRRCMLAAAFTRQWDTDYQGHTFFSGNASTLILAAVFTIHLAA